MPAPTSMEIGGWGTKEEEVTVGWRQAPRAPPAGSRETAGGRRLDPVAAVGRLDGDEFVLAHDQPRARPLRPWRWPPVQQPAGQAHRKLPRTGDAQAEAQHQREDGEHHRLDRIPKAAGRWSDGSGLDIE
jgi:hypothetical protein